jgi:hypothetical protein
MQAAVHRLILLRCVIVRRTTSFPADSQQTAAESSAGHDFSAGSAPHSLDGAPLLDSRHDFCRIKGCACAGRRLGCQVRLSLVYCKSFEEPARKPARFAGRRQ